MRYLSLVFISFFSIQISGLLAAEQCKTLKDCSEWAASKTGSKYDLGKWERRSIKFEKDFTLSEGDPDFLFNYILLSNELARIKRESGLYQVIQVKDLKDFQFPAARLEEIPPTLDFYSAEFPMGSNEKVKNALVVIKKYLSKYGRVLEVANSPKIQVIDTGIQLNTVKIIIGELNK